MNNRICTNFLLPLCGLALLYSCERKFLDVKPDKKQVVPQRTGDLQALLDNTAVMNLDMPVLGELGSDDFFLDDQLLNSPIMVPWERNAYLWVADIYEGFEHVKDWNNRYQQVFYSNEVLLKLDDIDADQNNKHVLNHLKGSALFYRAYAYFQLAQLFSPPYHSSTAKEQMGLPLKTDPDINKIPRRSSLEATYELIIADLKESIPLLDDLPAIKTRPSKWAAYALLSRIGLSMADYEMAEHYADLCLEIDDSLMDYNLIDHDSPTPFNLFNQEVIFHSSMHFALSLYPGYHSVDSLLMDAYDGDDLRKKVFFQNNNGRFWFKGSYDGSGSITLFNGLATDEVYLAKMECLARRGEIEECFSFLGNFLSNRYDNFEENRYVPTDGGGLLSHVLLERRKELLFRGLRWVDIRRLNLEGEYIINQRRLVNDQVVSIEPNSSRYVLPIPDNVVQNSGIHQNIR